jgi:hypothetical protein
MQWAVEVKGDGESLVSIESGGPMAGKSGFTDAEESAIREAAESLLAFIGPKGCKSCGGYVESPSNICEGCATDAASFL